jgi:hypothetical protein
MNDSVANQNQSRRYKRSHDAVASTLDDSVCLFNLKTCEYFSLNETGSAIWECIEKPATVAEITANIIEFYEINHEYCCSEIIAWLESAAAHGVIDVIH